MRDARRLLVAVAALAVVLVAALHSTPRHRVEAAGELTFLAFLELGVCDVTIVGPNLQFLPLDTSVTVNLTATGGTVSPSSRAMTAVGGPGSTVGEFTFITYTPSQPTGMITAIASNGMTGSTTISSNCTVTQSCPSPVVALAVGGGGGPTTTVTTSTTHHDTHTRIDQAGSLAYETTVAGSLGPNVLTLVTVPFAPNSPQADAAFAQVRATLQAAGGVNVSQPHLAQTTDHTDSVFIGSVCNHIETSITTTTTIGPATILVGEDQSETFFVAAGTLNVNTNTHTENFFDDVYIDTVTHTSVYGITADVPRQSQSSNVSAVAAAIAALGPRREPAAAASSEAQPSSAIVRPPNTGSGGLKDD